MLPLIRMIVDGSTGVAVDVPSKLLWIYYECIHNGACVIWTPWQLCPDYEGVLSFQVSLCT